MSMALAEDSSDGLWTGNDFTDTTDSVQVVNGVPSGTTTEVNRRITAPLANTGTELNYADATNVKLVQKFFGCT